MTRTAESDEAEEDDSDVGPKEGEDDEHIEFADTDSEFELSDEDEASTKKGGTESSALKWKTSLASKAASKFQTGRKADLMSLVYGGNAVETNGTDARAEDDADSDGLFRIRKSVGHDVDNERLADRSKIELAHAAWATDEAFEFAAKPSRCRAQ